MTSLDLAGFVIFILACLCYTRKQGPHFLLLTCFVAQIRECLVMCNILVGASLFQVIRNSDLTTRLGAFALNP